MCVCTFSPDCRRRTVAAATGDEPEHHQRVPLRQPSRRVRPRRAQPRLPLERGEGPQSTTKAPRVLSPSGRRCGAGPAPVSVSVRTAVVAQTKAVSLGVSETGQASTVARRDGPVTCGAMRCISFVIRYAFRTKVAFAAPALCMHMFGSAPGAHGWTWSARYKQKRGA